LRSSRLLRGYVSCVTGFAPRYFVGGHVRTRDDTNPSCGLKSTLRNEKPPMNSGEYWRMLFESWPSTLPRRGLLITTFGEAIPFVGYLLSPGIVLLDRDKPDSLGARKVMVAYEAISA